MTRTASTTVNAGSPLRASAGNSDVSHTMIDRQVALSRALGAGMDPTTANHIFGNPNEAAPSTSAAPVYQAPYVQPYYAPQYSTYAVPAMTADYPSSAAYATPINTAQTAVGSVQYTDLQAGGYGCPYAPTMSFATLATVPPTSNGTNGAHSNGSVNGHNGHH